MQQLAGSSSSAFLVACLCNSSRTPTPSSTDISSHPAAQSQRQKKKCCIMLQRNTASQEVVLQGSWPKKQVNRLRERKTSRGENSRGVCDQHFQAGPEPKLGLKN